MIAKPKLRNQNAEQQQSSIEDCDTTYRNSCRSRVISDKWPKILKSSEIH